MESKNSQKHYMQTELLQLLISILVATIFSWIGYYSFLGIPPSTLWPLLCFVCFLLAMYSTRRVKRAHIFYKWAFSVALLNAFILFENSLRLLITGWQLDLSILLGIGLTVTGGWSQLHTNKRQLKDSFQQNIQSGRLNVEQGFWDFDKPLHLNTRKAKDIKSKGLYRLSRLSPLVTAVGLAFAKSTDGEPQMVAFGVCLYVLGCVIAWGSVKYLAIALQLREWEAINKIEIKT